MGNGINKRGNQKENKRWKANRESRIEKEIERKMENEENIKEQNKRGEILKQEQQWIKKYDKKRIFGIDVVFHYEHLAC